MPITEDIRDHEVLGREYRRGQLRELMEELFGPLSPEIEQRLNAASVPN